MVNGNWLWKACFSFWAFFLWVSGQHTPTDQVHLLVGACVSAVWAWGAPLKLARAVAGPGQQGSARPTAPARSGSHWAALASGTALGMGQVRPRNQPTRRGQERHGRSVCRRQLFSFTFPAIRHVKEKDQAVLADHGKKGKDPKQFLPLHRKRYHFSFSSGPLAISHPYYRKGMVQKSCWCHIGEKDRKSSVIRHV